MPIYGPAPHRAPGETGVDVVIAIGGKWTTGSRVEVQCRIREGSTLLTLTEATIAPLPADTRGVVITRIRVLQGSHVEARIFPVHDQL